MALSASQGQPDFAPVGTGGIRLAKSEILVTKSRPKSQIFCLILGVGKIWENLRFWARLGHQNLRFCQAQNLAILTSFWGKMTQNR